MFLPQQKNLNISDFGAAGDGVTDNAAALKKLLKNAVKKAAEG